MMELEIATEEGQREQSTLDEAYYQLGMAMRMTKKSVEAWKLSQEVDRIFCLLKEAPSYTDGIGAEYYLKLWPLLERFDASMTSLDGCEDLVAYQEQIKAARVSLMHRYHQELIQAKQSKRVEEAGTERPQAPSRGERPHVSQLKINLPEFKGDILEWRDFWLAFDSVMRGQPYLSDIDKIGHLASCMKSPEAKLEARMASQSCTTYKEFVGRLRATYDVPKIVYRRHVQEIWNLKAMRESRDSYKEMLNTVDTHLAGMKAQNGYTVDQMVACKIASLLAPAAKQRCDEHTAEDVTPPSMEKMRAFLQNRVHTFDTQGDGKTYGWQAGHEDSPWKAPRREAPPQQKTFQKPVQKQYQQTSPKRQARPQLCCAMCQERHGIYHCEKFKELAVKERRQLVQKKNLCFRCLGEGHANTECRSTYKCKECKADHHSLLHKATTINMVKTGREIATMPRTIQVLASSGYLQQGARALLDSGSGSNLITSRLARSLKAKFEESYTTLFGLADTPVESSHKVTVVLDSVDSNNPSQITLEMQVVDKIGNGLTPFDGEDIKKREFLKGLNLADPLLGQPGRLEMLISAQDTIRMSLLGQRFSPDRMMLAENTIFGWTVGGGTYEKTEQSAVMRISQEQGEILNENLQRFWDAEASPEERVYTSDEQEAVDHFTRTHKRDEDGRYTIQLPRKTGPELKLGKSRPMAMSRLLSNERSLTNKHVLEAFQDGVLEYHQMGHAEVVPDEDKITEEGKSAYLPLHGVLKESSSTTKLRIVSDASAKTTSGLSLNDTLLTGPSFYPSVSHIINKFRSHKIGFSADISKMFREVGLQEEERDYHRFLARLPSGFIEEFRMMRLTFGVSSSPFLATMVLLQVAADYEDEFPLAARAIRSTFYVDDCIAGANNLEEAVEIRQQLNNLLSKASMTLRKWRSSSADLLQTIPEELQEETTEEDSPSSIQKALGIHWEVEGDVMYVAIPNFEREVEATKRTLASDAAKVYDIMGWFSPAILYIKLLLQKLWKEKIGWDDPVPEAIKNQWEIWRQQLPKLQEVPISRWLYEDEEVLSRQLHGFADASQDAYGAVESKK